MTARTKLLLLLFMSFLMTACKVASPTPTVLVRPATATPILKATKTPERAPTETATPELPESFTLLLVFEDDTTCTGNGFQYDYAVTLGTDTITMVQVVNGITSTGPYDPASGEFTAQATGLPGTETYAGTVELGGTIVMEGIYSYDDLNPATCLGTWPFSGEYTP